MIDKIVIIVLILSIILSIWCRAGLRLKPVGETPIGVIGSKVIGVLYSEFD